jgi:hypothetical protein
MPFMGDEFRLVTNEDARAYTCPESMRDDAKTPAARTAAAQCVYNNFGTEVKILAKRAAKAKVSPTFEGAEAPFLFGDEDGSFFEPLGAPGTLVFVPVATTISGVVAVVATTPAGVRVVGAYVWAPVGD